MKRKIWIALLLFVILMFSLLAFTACENNNDDSSNKQVPVYQGMTINKSNSALSLLSYRTSGITLLSANNENNGDNGNHYGHYKGDHTDRNDTIDKENPYPDNGANENIEEEIKSSLNVIGSPDTIYYAEPNEDIYINIHIDNPDSFEIMSFTLNGKKYSSYMFEEGSDMETIVLKYNVGDAVGIVEYTIDAIKYIDGTEIKDVIIDGNKTVMAGIKTENQVAANVSSVDFGTNALSFNVNIKDNNALVEFSKGALKAVLYDGFSIVAEKDLQVGDNTVSFDGLQTNNLYQYAVVGYYDNLSGNGFAMNILYKDAFYTDSVVLFDNMTVGQESISFGFRWHEDHQNKTISALKLYKGDFFVKDIDVSAASVTELLSATTYKLVAEYPNADKTESIYLEFTTLAKATPDITIANTAKGQESLTFSVSVTDADAVGAITKVELIRGTEITTLANVTTHEIKNLLSNNDYTIKVTYTYHLNDGAGEQTLTKELTAKTDAKATPDVSVLNPTKTQTSVGFEIAETDVDNVGTITKIELVHANGTVLADSLDQRTFANLLSNNTYTVKVTYIYNLNDGAGDKTVVKELIVTTLAKSAPGFAPKNENVTTDSISAEYDVTDVDNILASYKVELYQGTTLVLENAEKKIAFASLNYYTDYTLKITYTYNLNDGKGVQTSIFEKIYKTLPFIDVVECNVANTSAVSEGETIYMQVKLDNPLGMTVESVVINGKTYSVTGASTKNKIFVEIVYNGQFAGGDTYLKVDQVNAKLEGAPYTVAPETELADNVFINGKIEVLKIEFVNEDFDPIDWAFPSEKVYVMITLNNSTGYSIDSITESGSKSQGMVTDLKKLDDNHWYYELDFVLWANGVPFYDTSYDVVGLLTKTLDSLSYSNDYIAKTITYSEMRALFYRLSSDEIHYITSPDDLKSMNDKRYYELANDIDLSGLEWLGADFDGVFDGNGYSIKNLSFVGTVKNKHAYLGLFNYGTGVIQNLNVKDATVIAEVVADDGNQYEAYCGALVARAGNILHIQNCTVDAYSIFDLKNTTNGYTAAGGLVGRTVGTVTITNCTNSGSVSATGEAGEWDTCAGGLVGHTYDSTVTITNCNNNGSVSATSEAGGLVGHTDYSTVTITNCNNNGSVSATGEGDTCAFTGGLVGHTDYSTVTITNCNNSGSVSATDEWDTCAFAGGLVGYTYGSTVTITNCNNSGSVSATGKAGEWDTCAGGLVGHTDYSTVTITNCYSLVAGNGKGNGKTCTVEQLNSKGFYTETLGWSEDIWDFSELDVENGKYPKLKQ